MMEVISKPMFYRYLALANDSEKVGQRAVDLTSNPVKVFMEKGGKLPNFDLGLPSSLAYSGFRLCVWPATASDN